MLKSTNHASANILCSCLHPLQGSMHRHAPNQYSILHWYSDTTCKCTNEWVLFFFTVLEAAECTVCCLKIHARFRLLGLYAGILQKHSRFRGTAVVGVLKRCITGRAVKYLHRQDEPDMGSDPSKIPAWIPPKLTGMNATAKGFQFGKPKLEREVDKK